MYSVYKHTSPSGKIYIGITCQQVEKRWKNGRGYDHSPHFMSAIKKYGWENITHEILFDNLTKEEAEQKEVDLIKEYKTTNRLFGYNSDSGGNVKKCHSEETKNKISKSHKGMKYDDDFRKKQSLLKIGNKNMLGKKHTQETKDIISRKNKGRFSGDKNYFHTHIARGKDHPNSVKIDKLDMNGNFLESKDCAMDFARQLGVINCAHIIDVCKGKRISAYGYKWRYSQNGMV